MLLSSAARSPHGAATARVTWTQLLTRTSGLRQSRCSTCCVHSRARRTCSASLTVGVPPAAGAAMCAVLWQLLTLTATCKWMAHMTADAGTLTADVAKLLERSGRLGRHRVATFTFGVRCFDEPVGPVRGSSDGSCPGIPGQLPPRGPRPSSSTRSALSRLRKVRGSWSSNLRSPPSHPVCRRSRSMHRSALSRAC